MYGSAAVLAAVLLGKHSKKRDHKFTIGAALLACLLLFISCRNLIYAGVDMQESVKEVTVQEYYVSKIVSLRKLFRSYYLTGIDETGAERMYIIDKRTYCECEDRDPEAIEIVFWGHTGVVKEIGE